MIYVDNDVYMSSALEGYPGTAVQRPKCKLVCVCQRHLVDLQTSHAQPVKQCFQIYFFFLPASGTLSLLTSSLRCAWQGFKINVF